MRKDRLLADVLGEENVITPSDLYNQEFKRASVGGYRPEEVDACLERVADIMETLIEEVRRLRSETETQREELQEYRDIERALRSALVSSQQMGESLVESAKREAEAILAEARARKAESELATARLPEELAGEIARLTRQRDDLRDHMLALLDTHRRLVETSSDTTPEARRAAEYTPPRPAPKAIEPAEPAPETPQHETPVQEPPPAPAEPSPESNGQDPGGEAPLNEAPDSRGNIESAHGGNGTAAPERLARERARPEREEPEAELPAEAEEAWAEVLWRVSQKERGEDAEAASNASDAEDDGLPTASEAREALAGRSVVDPVPDVEWDDVLKPKRRPEG